MRGKVGTVEKDFLRNTDFTSYIVIEIAHQTNAGNIPYLVGAVFDYQHSTQTETHSFFSIPKVPLNDELFINGGTPKTKEEFFRDLKRNNISHKPFHNDLEGYKSDLKTILGNIKDSFFTLLPKGIAFSPITNLRNYVYDYILDEEPVDVSRMRDFMERMEELNRMIIRAENEITKLSEINNLYEKYEKITQGIVLNDYLIKKYDVESANEQIKIFNADIKLDIELQNKCIRTIEALKNSYKMLDVEIGELNKEVWAHNSTITADNLRSQINSLNSNIDELESLLTELKNSSKIEIRELSKLEYLLQHSDSPVELTHSILEVKHAMEEFVESNAFPQNNSFLAKKWGDAYQWLQQHLYKIETEQRTGEQVLNELDRTINQLENRNILSETSPSMKLKRLLEEHLIPIDNKQVRVDIFCEVIDVSNDEWKNAIEGYLHTQKFDILVSPGHFEQALEIYERMKFSYKIERIGLVNTDKLVLKKPTALPGSLAEEVTSTLTYALDYVNQLLGSILKVRDVSELKNHSRSITSTCMTYSNFTARQIPKERYEVPYIGKDAIEAQLKFKRLERVALAQHLEVLGNQIDEFKVLRNFNSNKHDKFAQMKSNVDKTLNLYSLSMKVSELNQKLIAIDMTEVEGLKQIIKTKKAEAESVNEDSRKKSAEEATIKQRIENNRAALIDFQNNLATATNTLYEFEERQVSYKVSDLEAIWREELLNHPYSQIKKNALSKVEKLKDEKGVFWGDIRVKRNDYNREFDIGYDAQEESNDKYKSRHSYLENEKIVDFKEKAVEAKEMAQQSFKEDFIAKLKEQIERAEEDFNALNRSLKDMKFGTDQYRFTYGARNDNEMMKYYKMLKDPNLIGASIFSYSFQEEYKDLIENLFDAIIRSRELRDYNELLDYRSYLDFELSVKDSQGNTIEYSKVALEKSGGETQVPFYVAILASFYYTYQLFRKTDTFRLVILDEAFNRMDAERVAEAIKFIKSCGFQPIIVTPTGSVHMYSIHMENTFVVLKDNYHSFVAPFSINSEEQDAYRTTETTTP
nr:SbcC/MukB-like Walker B domain-containing protein [Paenibacillus sp. Marseille-Q4541]